jgi:Tol biopolymer transport system component
MKRIVCAVGSFPRYDLHVMNVDGSDHRVLLRSDRIAALPKWSRDGRRIAYNHAAFSSRRTTGDIRLLNDDGSDVRQITESRGDSVSENPYWSPDGRRIAFQSNRTGNFQIYVMNADGTGPVRLTKHPGNDYWPSWSRAPASGAPRR